jgi:hypothetical protein
MILKFLVMFYPDLVITQFKKLPGWEGGKQMGKCRGFKQRK